MSQQSINENLQNYISPEYVNLSSLPAPKVVDELSFDAIFQDLLADFKKRKPEYTALVASDPVIIALECSAYRELLLRNKINEAAKANMLAYATGTDLDNLVAFYGVERLVGEDDERLRYRARLSLDSLTTAGSENAYLFHTLSATTEVKSASVQSLEKGKVTISILSNQGQGVAEENLITTVKNYISSDEKRPLTDFIIVQSAEIKSYTIKAKLFVYSGPSATITAEESESRLRKYLQKQHNIGSTVALSGIYKALHNEGVQRVELTHPTADIVTTKQQAPHCESLEITLEFLNNE